MNERLMQGQLVGLVLKESEARLRIQKIELANVRQLDKYIIYRRVGESREFLLSPEESGIQYVFPELTPILEPQKK